MSWRASSTCSPCLVVASSYDPWMDPALEPELVTPYPALRLILLRTIAVLALAVPAVLLFGLVVPGETAFAWLLPAVGFVAVVLAASTWVSPLRAAIAVSSAWLATVWLLAARPGSPESVLQARAQAAVLVLMAPGLVPQAARWVRTFPAPGAGGPSSDHVWWTVLAVCAAAIAISAGGRRLPRWRARGAIPRLPGAVRP